MKQRKTLVWLELTNYRLRANRATDCATPPLIIYYTKHCIRQKTDCARLLIDRGADLSIRSREGATVVHAAARKDLPELLKLFIEKGCDINVQVCA